jgi:hypothetical protein
MKARTPPETRRERSSAQAPRPIRLPRHALTAEQGYWSARRILRVAEVDRDTTHVYEGPRGVAIVERALRHVMAFLFALLLCLVVSVPALAAPTNLNLDTPEKPRPFTGDADKAASAVYSR